MQTVTQCPYLQRLSLTMPEHHHISYSQKLRSEASITFIAGAVEHLAGVQDSVQQ